MKDAQALCIGQFTDSFPPVINGVSVLVAQYHAELRAQGQAAHVFTVGPAGDAIDPPNVWRTHGARLGTSQFHATVWLNRASSRAARSLQVIHAHDSVAIGLIAARIARRTGRPLVFTNHTRHDFYVKNYPSWLQPILCRYILGSIRRLIRTSALTTTPSRDSARWLRSLVPDRANAIRVIQNGIRLDQFDHIEDRIDRRVFGIDTRQTLFIYVGRLAPEKDLSVFAEALIRAIRDGADAHWLVVGDGPSRADLEAEVAPIRPRVHFLGAVPNAHVAPLLAMADVFATPSISETNPVSVIEAMACGLPYLGLEAGWWGDFSTDDGSGLAGVLTGDPIELAQTIRQLCDDAALRAHLGAQAKRLSRRFDIRTVTAQWIEIYRSLEATGEARPFPTGAPVYR
ncbi:MAG TPA: glycosyltransferase family 4 protein [Anaerolineae bacterium]